MKIFPYIIVRTGGIPYPKFDQIGFIDQATIRMWSNLDSKKNDLKKDILQSLSNSFRNSKDYQLKDMVGNASRDFYNNRKVQIQKLIDKALFDEDKKTLSSIGSMLKQPTQS